MGVLKEIMTTIAKSDKRCEHKYFNIRSWAVKDHMEGEIKCSSCGYIDEEHTKKLNDKLLGAILLT